MFIWINDENRNKIEVLEVIYSNIAYLMNNIQDEEFFEKLDVTMQDITALLIMSMIVGDTNLHNIVQDNLDSLDENVILENHSIPKRIDLNDKGTILKALVKILTGIHDSFDFEKKKECFTYIFRSTNWVVQNVYLRPIKEIYSSYFDIYRVVYDDNECKDEMISRLKKNGLIILNIIDREDKLIWGNYDLVSV